MAWPEVGITDLGLQKHIKYQVFLPYYQVDGVIIMNLDTWKQLSRKDQDLIHQGAREVEKDLPGQMGLFIANEQKKLKNAGIKEIKFAEQEYVK